jgi:N-acetylneuraminate synthase
MKKFGPFFLHEDRPVIIAEAGVNHGCDIILARKYIDLAKEFNCDAIKFQTYKANLLASEYAKAYWDLKEESSSSQRKLFSKYDKFNYKDYKNLYQYAKSRKIIFMTTNFDVANVKSLNKFISVHKISSSDINNIPLLREIGKTRKNVILSTGASTTEDIRFALKILNLPDHKVCLMHCVLNYPTSYKNANLKLIQVLSKKFPNNLIGYSDHTKPTDRLEIFNEAFNLGAKIIEKHFTHNKSLKGNDHYHSMDKKNLKSYFDYISWKKVIMGNGIKNLKIEKKSIYHARRGIYAYSKIDKGEIFTENNMIALRPAYKNTVKNWDKFLGKRAKNNYLQGDPIF